MPPLPPRVAVTAEDIERVVVRFYARARVHKVLRPIFVAHITDWPVHEAKIMRFWRNAILGEGGYEGSPMLAHRRAGDVQGGHFPVWLELFDTILHETLPPLPAAQWSALAHRIGQGLRQGVEDMGRPSDAVPKLR